MLTALALAVLVAVYVRGATGRPGVARDAALLGGVAALAVALVSPLEGAADDALTPHMVQHLLLVSVAGPLLVLADPVGPLLRGLPRRLRRPASRAVRPLLVGGRRHPSATALGAAVVHVLVLLAWHVPVAYDAAVRHDALHVAEHVTLLGTALGFWWAVLPRGRRPPAAPAAAFAGALLAVAAGLSLGFLLTVSSRVWYADAAEDLADQQVAGALMWALGGVVYLAAALAVVVRSLGDGDGDGGGGGGGGGGGATGGPVPPPAVPGRRGGAETPS